MPALQLPSWPVQLHDRDQPLVLVDPNSNREWLVQLQVQENVYSSQSKFVFVGVRGR